MIFITIQHRIGTWRLPMAVDSTPKNESNKVWSQLAMPPHRPGSLSLRSLSGKEYIFPPAILDHSVLSFYEVDIDDPEKVYLITPEFVKA